MSRPRALQPPSTALYPHPFSAAYWRDAAAELTRTRVLVFAALMIALRVALKGFGIPLAPNLKINIAFFVNAFGAMVFGPVVAVLAACVSDTLGCLLFPSGPYFFPFILTEIAGSLIFALFLYRAKITPARVILSRFCICFFVNILLNAPITWWYYKLILGKSYVLFQLPHILKNLFCFPIESVLLTLFLRAMVPVAYRLGLVYDTGQRIRFQKRQIVLLVGLFLAGVVSVLAYLNYYYDTTSLSASYSPQERYEVNRSMEEVVADDIPAEPGQATVCVVESAYRKFLSPKVTYTVAVYAVDPQALGQSAAEALDSYRGLSKSKAAAEAALTRIATATVVRHEPDGEVLSLSVAPDGPETGK